MPALAPDDALLRHARRRGRRACTRRSRGTRSNRGSSPETENEAKSTTIRLSHAGRKVEQLVAGSSGTRARARLRPHEARRRTPRQSSAATACMRQRVHGDMSQSARETCAGALPPAGKVTTLVATDVAARGLDLDDITHVINFDPPEDDKLRAPRRPHGRAGSAAAASRCPSRSRQADVSRVATGSATASVREEGMQTARPKLLYTSRRGRRSRW